MRPTETLKAEHRVIEQVLACLEAMTDRACVSGVLDGASACEALDFFRHFADGCHHAKEETLLFPLLESLGFPPGDGPTEVMRQEHHTGRQLLHGMEENLEPAAAGDPDALARFADDAWDYVRLLREHILTEDLRLFVMADRLLSPDDQRLLRTKFEKIEQEKAPGTHERYLARANVLAERFGVPPAVAHGDARPCCSPARGRQAEIIPS